MNRFSQVIRAVTETLTELRYLLVAFVSGFVAVTALTIGQNTTLVWTVFTEPSLRFVDRLVVFIYLYPGIGGASDIIHDSGIVLATVLFGLNAALIAKLYMTSRLTIRQSSTSIFGTVAAVFGVGCAVCGPALAGTLTVIGGSTLLTVFPYGGQEFLWIAIGLLLWSTYLNSMSLGPCLRQQ